MNAVNPVNKELAEHGHQACAFGVAVDDLVIIVQQTLCCSLGFTNVAGHLVEFCLDVVSA